MSIFHFLNMFILGESSLIKSKKKCIVSLVLFLAIVNNCCLLAIAVSAKQLSSNYF